MTETDFQETDEMGSVDALEEKAHEEAPAP